MRWREGKRSGNIEDRRSLGVPGGAAGGIGGISLIIVLLLAVALGVDPTQFLESSDFSSGAGVEQSGLSEEEQNQLADHVSLVLGDTETTWSSIFSEKLGKRYIEPKLVLFTGSVDSACGFANSAIGPFYCPADQKVYLDLEFFYELQERFGAPGDFAQAYVISHEIDHHVQNQVGISDYVNRAGYQLTEREANKLSVAQELQADCYAGVWANRAQNRNLILETGDLEEGLGAANAVGDDRLQKESQGYVVPDSFTHGTSKERMEWFSKGYNTGDISACDCPPLPPVT